nr:pitrilysin family protein [Crateriforma spongiae]
MNFTAIANLGRPRNHSPSALLRIRKHSSLPITGTFLAAFFACMICLSLPADAQDTDAAPNQTAQSSGNSSPNQDEASIMKVTEIEGITEYRMDNGVKVLLFPDPSKEVVTVNMTVFVGSRHEGYGEAGMAHLLEHMLFKGTPTHPNVPKSLQDRGARFNGTTWLDRTNYYETLPASDENLEFALKLESDRLVNSLIRGEDLESEMTVVRSEFEQGENSPVRVLMQRMQSAAYEWHNYGKTTIGNRSDIERVPVVRLRRFYRKFYRPDNIMVVVAGKFDPDTAIEMLQETFGKLQVPESPIDDTYTVEPAQDGERTVVLRRVGDVQWVGSSYHVPAGSHQDYAAVAALQYILGDEPSGRLYKSLVETELASNVYAMVNGLYEPGLFKVLAEVPKDQSIEEARLKLIEVMERSFTESPVTEAELDRAVQNLLKQRELQAADSDRIAVALSDWAAQGDWRLYFLFRDNLEKLTVDQVQQVAQRYFIRDNRTVGLFIPTDEVQRVTIPESPDLATVLDGYKGREAVSQGEQFDPDPLAIQARVQQGELTGGIEYALLPKKTRGESVVLQLRLRFGTGQTLNERRGAVELLGLAMARGTEKLDYQELQDELTRLRAELSMFSQIGQLNVQVQTKREFVPEVIALIGDLVRHPRFDSDELEVIRRQILTSLEQNMNDPGSQAARAVQRALSPDDPSNIRYVQTLEEEIAMYESVTIDEIRDLYNEFLGNQAGQLIAVGDFEPEEIINGFSSFLTDWRSDQPYERIGRSTIVLDSALRPIIETPDKENAVLYGGQQYALSDTSDEYAALVLGNFILGSSGLSSRLGDRVRQQEGLSYGVGTGLTAYAKDDLVSLTLYAITNPMNREKIVEVITEVINDLRENGVTEDELQRAKNAYLQKQRVGRTQDRNLAVLLGNNLFYDRTMEHQARYEQQIAEASLEQVNQAIRNHIDPEKMIIALAGDFAGAEVTAP